MWAVNAYPAGNQVGDQVGSVYIAILYNASEHPFREPANQDVGMAPSEYRSVYAMRLMRYAQYLGRSLVFRGEDVKMKEQLLSFTFAVMN